MKSSTLGLVAAGLTGLAALVSCEQQSVPDSQTASAAIEQEPFWQVITHDGLDSYVRLTPRGHEYLEEKFGIAPDVANAYNHAFLDTVKMSWEQLSSALDKTELVKLHNIGAVPDVANAYLPRFVFGASSLHKAAIDSDTAHQYADEFNSYSIIDMHQTGVIPDIANAYDSRFRIGRTHIPDLFDRGYTPDIANAFDERFTGGAVSLMSSDGIMPEYANDFSPNFGFFAIRRFNDVGLQPDYVNKFQALNEEFGTKLNSHDILMFHRNDIPYELVREEAVRTAVRRSIER